MELLDSEKEINKAKLEIIVNGLRNFAKGDIEKSLEKDMLLASFILCVCFIDQVSGYYCGVNHMDNKKRPLVGMRFKQFCKDYLNSKIDSRYNPNHLYKKLRNDIVHSYSTTGYYSLGKGIKGFHLRKIDNGSILLNADDFFRDITNAFEEWVHDLNKSEELQYNALKWFKTHKTFEQIPIEAKNKKKGINRHSIMRK